MKLISIVCVVLSIVLGIATYSAPLWSSQGTSVIEMITSDNNIQTIKLPDQLTPKQTELLSFAYKVAKADGYEHPSYLQGIILQESNGCDMKNFRVAGLTNRIGDRYFGCGQVKLAAAKEVMKAYPEMWKYLDTQTDEELQARLIVDDEFNIRIASKYCYMMGINKNPGRAITAYNVGPGAVRNVNPATHNYTKRVNGFSQKLENVQAADHRLQSIDTKPYVILLARDP